MAAGPPGDPEDDAVCEGDPGDPEDDALCEGDSGRRGRCTGHGRAGPKIRSRPHSGTLRTRLWIQENGSGLCEPLRTLAPHWQERRVVGGDGVLFDSCRVCRVLTAWALPFGITRSVRPGHTGASARDSDR